MKLQTLQAENLFSYQQLSFNLDNLGLALLKGANGAGKSSIIKTIDFVLFGVGADSVINKRVGKDAYGSVSGSKGKDHFVVTRYRRHSTHKNNLYLTINGEEVEAATTTDLQKKVETFLGIDRRSFLSIASFSSEMLSFAAAGDADRKAIFEKIIQDLDIYNGYQRTAKDLQASVLAKLSEVDERIAVESREVAVLQNIIAQEQKNAKFFEKDREERVTELSTRIAALKKEEAKAEAVKDKIDRYKKAQKKLLLYVGKHLTSTELPHLDYEDKVLAQKISDLEDDRCSSCGQEITGEYRHSKIREYGKKRKVLRKEIEKLVRIESLRGKFQTKHDALEVTITKLTYSLRSLGLLKHDIKEYEAQLEKEKVATNVHEENFVRAAKRIKRVSKLIKGLNNDKKKYSEELLYLEEEVKAFSKQGIPNVVVSRALGSLEERANHYLSLLSGGTLGIKITGSTMTKKGAIRNKIGLDVISDNDVTDFNSYSGGERQRLNIAILLALRDVAELNKGTKLNVIFLDEVLDLSLDTNGLEEVLSLLQIKRDTVDSILVLSPKAELLTNASIEFDHIFTAQKVSGFSSIS